jgi:hypothetical protein
VIGRWSRPNTQLQWKAKSTGYANIVLDAFGEPNGPDFREIATILNNAKSGFFTFPPIGSALVGGVVTWLSNPQVGDLWGFGFKWL